MNNMNLPETTNWFRRIGKGDSQITVSLACIAGPTDVNWEVGLSGQGDLTFVRGVIPEQAADLFMEITQDIRDRKGNISHAVEKYGLSQHGDSII